MERTIICISCPVGCRMKVKTNDGSFVSVEGNTCKLGEVYARQESVSPKRMVTAVVPVKDRRMPLSVKTYEPIDKDKIKSVIDSLAKLELSPPIKMGQVIVENIFNTGVDIVATKPID